MKPLMNHCSTNHSQGLSLLDLTVIHPWLDSHCWYSVVRRVSFSTQNLPSSHPWRWWSQWAPPGSNPVRQHQNQKMHSARRQKGAKIISSLYDEEDGDDEIQAPVRTKGECSAANYRDQPAKPATATFKTRAKKELKRPTKPSIHDEEVSRKKWIWNGYGDDVVMTCADWNRTKTL